MSFVSLAAAKASQRAMLLIEARQFRDQGQWRPAVGRYQQAAALSEPGPFREECEREAREVLRWTKGLHLDLTEADATGALGALLALPSITTPRGTSSQPMPLPPIYNARSDEVLLDATTLLLSGKPTSALRLLREGRRPDPSAKAFGDFAIQMLAEALDLALQPVPDLTALLAVAEQAEEQGWGWLARMGRAATVLSGLEHTFEAQADISLSCEQEGDAWGLLLSECCAALGRVRNGETPSDAFMLCAHLAHDIGALLLEAWCHVFAAATRAFSYDRVRAAALREMVLDQHGPTALAMCEQVVLSWVVAAEARNSDTPPPAQEFLIHGSPQISAPARLSWLVSAMPTGGALKSTSDQSFEPAADNGTLHQSSGAEKLRDSSKPVQGADETPVAPLQKAANTEQGIRSTASVVLAPVQIDCFEHFDVRFSGNAADLSQLRPKARSVLYYLACHHERLVPEESLIGALWPDMEISSARHNLQVAVSAVRRLLAPTASVGRNEILRREGRCYVLSLPPGSEVDVQGFERALDACRTTRTISSTSEIAGHLRTALSLYKGQRGLIPEAGTAEWILPLRDQYAYEVQQAALQLAEIEIKSGAYPAALALTKRVLHRDPYNDAGWRTLIKTHETAGDRAEAARAQRAYQLLLESVADSSRANSA